MTEVTGSPGYDVVRDYVTGPLELDHTWGVSEQPTAVVRGYADLHGRGRLLDHTELTEGVMLGEGKLDGGLTTTPGDVVLLLDAFAKGTLLEPSSFEAMSAFRDHGPEGVETGYGLGLARIETPYGTAWGHTGGVYPFLSTAFHFPDHNKTVVVAINGFTTESSDWMGATDVFDSAF